jgi:hypothetical protein
MKTLSANLTTHVAQEVTTLSTCWKITRRDGEVKAFTDHDQNLVVGGVTFLAQSGYTRSAVQTSDQLNVDTLEAEGVLVSDQLSDEDLRNGLYDRSQIEIFLVNWNDLTGGMLTLRRGWLGEVEREGAGYKAELRGLLQAFAQHYGQLYSPDCRADLGDSRCGIVLVPTAWQALTVYAVGDLVRSTAANNRRFTCTTAGTSGAGEPTWNTTPAGTTADASIIWTTAAETFYAEATVATVGTARRSFTATALSGFTLQTTTVLPVPAWEAEHLYHPSFSVQPTTPTDRRYVTEVKGTSGKTEPGWPTSGTDTITDNKLVWKPVRDEWYGGGLLTWLTGANAGLTAEVKRYQVTGSGPSTFTFETFLESAYDIAVSDTFRVEAGCNKLRSTCQIKFANLPHFRGEPFVPGINTLLDYPDARGLEDAIDDH